MDSVTQLLLGASVTAAIAPPQYRRAAVLIGAALGTLPDLDVMIDHGGDVWNFTDHRSYSHSLFVLPFVAVALWGLLLAVWRGAREHRWRWLAAFQLALLTHPLLDAFTVYGTQLFWPLSTPPVSIGSIFIIDPAYTLPLLVGVVAALGLGPRPKAGFWLGLGLLLSQGYLAWTWIVQQQIRDAVVADMVEEGIPDTKVLVTPTPFNSLMWRIVAAYPSGDYGEGYWSLLDPKPSLRMLIFQGNQHMLSPLADDAEVKRLRWFTQGFLAADEVDGRIVAKDLRMGVEGAYVFRFAVGERRDGEIVALETSEQMPWARRDLAKVREIWQRAREGQPSQTQAEIGAPTAAGPFAPPSSGLTPLLNAAIAEGSPEVAPAADPESADATATDNQEKEAPR